MKTKKILLAFDGSNQSLNAAELCWELAAKYPIALTAQHVVNTVGLWQLLNFELPGLTGSGPYLTAHQAMGQELRSIGETLVTIYETKARSHGIADQCVIDEGDAISEVMRRSAVHDIVVIGHHSNGADGIDGGKATAGQMPRYLTHSSMAETLSRVIEKPLLVVQSVCQPWRNIKLILYGTNGVESSFRAGAELAAFFNLPLEVDMYFEGPADEADISDLSELTREAMKEYPHLQIITRKARLWPNKTNQHMANVDCSADTLVIVPTFASGLERCSAFGTTLDLFVRYSGVPTLLLWPADAQASKNKQLLAETVPGK
jgi:hypothetical protein